MSKDSTNKGHYFTFPLKFLWGKPEEYRERFSDIICYSIFDMIRRGEFGDFNPKDSKSVQGIEKKAREKFYMRGGSFEVWKASYIKLSALCPPTDKGIYTSVKTSFLFDARDGKLDTDLLLLVASVRSIIGMKRNFTRASREEIVKRMYGGSPDRLKRYAFNKLFDAATAKRMCARIPAGRGFYVSIRYDVATLAREVEDRITRYYTEKSNAADAGRRIANLKRSFKREIERIPAISQ